jgi:hypothetical protein
LIGILSISKSFFRHRDSVCFYKLCNA